MSELNTLDEMIEVLQAYKAGKYIQVFHSLEKKWIDINVPFWSFSVRKYRVKQEPRRFKVTGSVSGICSWRCVNGSLGDGEEIEVIEIMKGES